MHFRFNLRIDADSACHQVLVLRKPRLLPGYHAAIYLFLQQRMVTRHLLKSIVAQPVEPGVPDVADRHLIVMPQRHHQCGAHAGVLRLALRCLVNGKVGFYGMFADQALGAAARNLSAFAAQHLLQFGRNHGHSNAARHFAGVVAAHAVGQHGQPDLGIRGYAVLVVRAHHSRVGGGRDFKSSA